MSGMVCNSPPVEGCPRKRAGWFIVRTYDNSQQYRYAFRIPARNRFSVSMLLLTTIPENTIGTLWRVVVGKCAGKLPEHCQIVMLFSAPHT